jgi:5-formyltetrahydrofolate cyclo-ligase
MDSIHPLQIVDNDLPEIDHDFGIDYIVTPEEIVSTRRENGCPKGIIRDHLTEDKISDIPILREILSQPVIDPIEYTYLSEIQRPPGG